MAPSSQSRTIPALVLGACVAFGLAALGSQLAAAAIRFRELERTVSVKGLSEREFPADVVIWPIQFTVADNDLAALYRSIDAATGRVRQFLRERGIEDGEVSVAAPAVVDRAAERFGDGQPGDFRYSARQVLTVYSSHVDKVREAMGAVSGIGRHGIALAAADYENPTEYLFTRLNEVKPGMIQEATTKAREVAEKFAADSASRLGRIRSATQGQFTIESRDRNNPHVKRVRVVSTVEYYLAD